MNAGLLVIYITLGFIGAIALFCGAEVLILNIYWKIKDKIDENKKKDISESDNLGDKK